MDRIHPLPLDARGQVRDAMNGHGLEAIDPAQDALEAGIERIRDEARRMAREDAACGMPPEGSDVPTESELELQHRCSAFLERWESRERRRLRREVAEGEEQVAQKLGRITLGVDRFERITNELVRLKARFAVRRRDVSKELTQGALTRSRGIPTGLYVLALVVLGLVEFFANAPVFNALLPRDPLSERQIRLLTEISTGWLAGLERLGAHILFRPDAALLAAGVIIFLCVLAHFFGHALRDLVMQGGRGERHHTVHSRSARENVVPLVLSGVGLALTLGVLYEARHTLGEVGQERYVTDMAEVEELRRQAGWLRVDGEILQANALTNRAEDTEQVAMELREYSVAMARMNFPVLLLNLTLVICAISAAYFHRRDGRLEHLNEAPFEDDRQIYLDRGEECARETSELLADVVMDIRLLKGLTLDEPEADRRAVIQQLESIFFAYRAENGRSRNLRLPPAANHGSRFIASAEGTMQTNGKLTLRNPEDYEEERAQLAARFRDLRGRFNEEAAAIW